MALTKSRSRSTSSHAMIASQNRHKARTGLDRLLTTMPSFLVALIKAKAQTKVVPFHYRSVTIILIDLVMIMIFHVARKITTRAIQRAWCENIHEVLACVGDLDRSGRIPRVADVT